MTNFERVINLAGQLGEVEISSNDGTDVSMVIDTYDIYENSISIADLDGNEILIDADNIISVEGNKVCLKYFP